MLRVRNYYDLPMAARRTRNPEELNGEPALAAPPGSRGEHTQARDAIARCLANDQDVPTPDTAHYRLADKVLAALDQNGITLNVPSPRGGWSSARG